MSTKHDVVVIGGGAGGIAAASSILKRAPDLDVVIVEPSDTHRYQPGLTMVGAGVFESAQIVRSMSSVIPKRSTWARARVETLQPQNNAVTLDSGETLTYRYLVIAPGLQLDWEGIEGLAETLGTNGVTSNYAPDCAPYTWRLVQGMQRGRAVFSQPPMPIKCAGAPQKAVYLSCHTWERLHRLDDIEVSFRNAGGVLFGVPDYVPALEGYMDRYGVERVYNQNLVAVDGPGKKAWFAGPDGKEAVEFDMLHVCPPQSAPDFIRDSDVAGDAGWVAVDQATLQHVGFENVFSLGDVASTPNAKTAAAVRKQAPVVAENIVSDMAGRGLVAEYDGYGSCPLTVEKGKVVLAEFGYGGKLLPTAPNWLLDGRKATRLAWHLKATLLPPIYFDLMLKGREWFASPLQHAEDGDVVLARS